MLPVAECVRTHVAEPAPNLVLAAASLKPVKLLNPHAGVKLRDQAGTKKQQHFSQKSPKENLKRQLAGDQVAKAQTLGPQPLALNRTKTPNPCARHSHVDTAPQKAATKQPQ